MQVGKLEEPQSATKNQAYFAEESPGPLVEIYISSLQCKSFFGISGVHLVIVSRDHKKIQEACWSSVARTSG